MLRDLAYPGLPLPRQLGSWHIRCFEGPLRCLVPEINMMHREVVWPELWSFRMHMLNENNCLLFWRWTKGVPEESATRDTTVDGCVRDHGNTVTFVNDVMKPSHPALPHNVHVLCLISVIRQLGRDNVVYETHCCPTQPGCKSDCKIKLGIS